MSNGDEGDKVFCHFCGYTTFTGQFQIGDDCPSCNKGMFKKEPRTGETA